MRFPIFPYWAGFNTSNQSPGKIDPTDIVLAQTFDSIPIHVYKNKLWLKCKHHMEKAVEKMLLFAMFFIIMIYAVVVNVL
jgi:hypothetical protein